MYLWGWYTVNLTHQYKAVISLLYRWLGHESRCLSIPSIACSCWWNKTALTRYMHLPRNSNWLDIGYLTTHYNQILYRVLEFWAMMNIYCMGLHELLLVILNCSVISHIMQNAHSQCITEIFIFIHYNENTISTDTWAIIHVTAKLSL